MRIIVNNYSITKTQKQRLHLILRHIADRRARFRVKQERNNLENSIKIYRNLHCRTLMITTKENMLRWKRIKKLPFRLQYKYIANKLNNSFRIFFKYHALNFSEKEKKNL